MNVNKLRFLLLGKNNIEKIKNLNALNLNRYKRQKNNKFKH